MGRELSDPEREVLCFLLEHGATFADDPPVTFEQRARWRAKVADARAGAPCGCGTCPSIALEDAAGHVPERGRRFVLCAGHPDASLMLFIDSDRLSYLELAPHGDDVFARFPQASELI
jgi:hypothetical protein